MQRVESRSLLNGSKKEKEMKKKIEIEIEAPTVPNFLRNIVKGRDKAILVPVQDFTDDELRKIGEEWTELLIKNAKKKRKQNDKR